MKNTFGTIILFTSAIALAAIVLESFARITVGVPLKEKLPLLSVKADQDIGWVMVPSDEHYTYKYPVKLNKLGLRDSEISPKHPREYRILALGDSHIYGQGVGENGLLTSVLEQELNKSKKRTCYFNVINMGVRAYSTNNEAAILEKVGVGLEPEHVILFFYINDFIPVNIANRYRRFSGMDWYMFDLSGKPTEQVVKKWKVVQLFRSSAFLMWVYDLYRGWSSDSNYINRMLLGELDDETRNNIENTVESMEKIRSLADEYGFRLTLAVIPVAAQVTQTFPDQLYQGTLEAYAANAGLDYVDLLPDLRLHHSQYQDAITIPFDGHYNSQGHRVMASSMLDYLDGLDLCQ